MPSPDPEVPVLAFIGGTGPEGRGLALRFASLGHRVIIGSRSAERASETANELKGSLPAEAISGADNVRAASEAEIIFLTIPFSGIQATLPPLVDPTKGKIVVSTIAPIEFKDGRPALVALPRGSAAEEVSALLPDARVVSAFQVIDAHQLQMVEEAIETDVVVCSDDTEARRSVVALAGSIPGVKAVSGGRLAASRFIEPCTGLLITINRIYKVHSGIRFTGLNR